MLDHRQYPGYATVIIAFCLMSLPRTIILNLFICLFGNYSQTIGPEGLKFSGFDGGHPGDIIRKFGDDYFVR